MQTQQEQPKIEEILKKYAEMQRQLGSVQPERSKSDRSVEDKIEAENPFYSRNTLITYGF